MSSDKPIWIQYATTWEHLSTIPQEVQRAVMQLGGNLSLIVYQSWSFTDDPKLITPGYRPPVFQGDGLDMEGRRGDWIVIEAHTYHPSTDAPCQAIVVCTVEYQPVPQHEQSWVAVQNTIEPVLEPA